MNEQMLPELVHSSQIITSKHYSSGSVFLLRMTEMMLVVLCYTKLSQEPIYSRVYFFSDSNECDVMKDAKKQFRIIKECLLQRKIDLIEDLD